MGTLRRDKNIIAALLMSCFFFLSCENDINKVVESGKRKTGVEVALNVVLNYSTGGLRTADLHSPLMYRVQDTIPYIEFPKKIHVDFFAETGNIESLLDAKYARYIESQSKIYLRDSVRFLGLKNGDTLYCNELYWDRARPVYQFYTDKPVQIRTKTQIIDGVGFETSQDFKEKLIRNVTNSVLKVPASEFPN